MLSAPLLSMLVVPAAYRLMRRRAEAVPAVAGDVDEAAPQAAGAATPRKA
jgi:hypothetical protein